MNGMLMNGMIAPLSTGTDRSNCPLKIGDAAHRMARSPDGASLIQATKSGQLSGTHNLNNAITALDAQGAKYTITPTSTTGISELWYTYTNSAGKTVSGSKTVYDPAVFSDQVMLGNAQNAGQQAWTQYLKDPSLKVIDTTQGNINFRSYINFDKNGNAFIGNVHPIK